MLDKIVFLGCERSDKSDSVSGLLGGASAAQKGNRHLLRDGPEIDISQSNSER